jgi:uncharacterized protein YaaQ
MDTSIPNRLAILTLSGTQKDKLFSNLAKEKFSFTLINSSGGSFLEAEVCLLVGFHSDRLEILLEVLRRNCRPYRNYVSMPGIMQGEMANLPVVEAESGGAKFYVLEVERFEQI